MESHPVQPKRPPTRFGPADFQGIDLNRPGKWAVAFLADWCPFCRRFVPDFSALDSNGFGLAWADISADDNPLWDRFDIEVIPTVIVFRDRKAIFRADGRYGIGLLPDDLAAITAAGSAE